MRGRIGFTATFCLCIAIAGCGGGPSLPKTVATPPGNTGGSPPPAITPTPSAPQSPMFNPASVRIAEIPVPAESPTSNGAVNPDTIDAGSDGAVYFGQLNSGLATTGNFGLFRYFGGSIVQTLPFAQSGASAGGADAIDAHDSTAVMWSSSYQFFPSSIAFGDALECGGMGTASACAANAFGGFILSIVIAKDGTVWTAGAQCCGSGPGGYPAQLPTDGATASAFALVLANGPNSHVWGALEHGGPIYEFGSNGAVVNAYALPAGSVLRGTDELAQGADGALWFTDDGHNAIARITSAGQITEFPIPTPGSGVASIAVAADGSMWFTETTANKIGRIDTAGKIYEFAVPAPNAAPTAIAAVPPMSSATPAKLWFTETASNNIASITY